MPYVIGIVVSVGVALLGRYGGFDRDRAFYPTVLIVVGHYYVLFAAMGDSVQTVLLESAVMTLFVIAAVGGFTLNLNLPARPLVSDLQPQTICPST